MEANKLYNTKIVLSDMALFCIYIMYKRCVRTFISTIVCIVQNTCKKL